MKLKLLAICVGLTLAVCSPTLAISQEVSGEELEELSRKGDDRPIPQVVKEKGIALLDLILKGGWMMIPIGVMSLLVVTLAVERSLSLRAGRFIPPRLIHELEGMNRHYDTLDPQKACDACRANPSVASRVILGMLSRCGRSVAEVEQAATEVAQRETDRLNGPTRWLTLAAAVTPLMGLLGTVWGMVVCFHDLVGIGVGQNKAEALASGIYTALITTVGGLVVAIPATILAHYFEGRLLRRMRRVEELAFRFAPGLERFVGRFRIDGDGKLIPLATTAPAGPPPVKQATPPPVQVAGRKK